MDVWTQAAPFLLRGLVWTIYLSALALVLSLVLGFVGGLVRHARIPVLDQLLGLWVTLVRGTPFLLVLFIIFYVIPSFGVRLEAFEAGVLGLVIHEGAYMMEIVRGALAAIDKGQHEAAKALGLNYFQRMRFVIIPQAVRGMLPPTAGQTVLLIKATSIVSLIGITEVTRVGQQFTQRGDSPFVIFGMVALFYFAICYPLVYLSEVLERRMSEWA